MMKTIGKLFGLLLALCSAAHAHGDKIAMMKLHLPVVLEAFRAEEPSRFTLFSGIKAWPVDHSIQARIYLSDGSTLTYSCQEVAGDQVRCQRL